MTATATATATRLRRLAQVWHLVPPAHRAQLDLDVRRLVDLVDQLVGTDQETGK